MKAGIQKNNDGFSLVELIVSILIMSIIAGVVVILIMTSRTAYNVVNTDAVLQGEAEAVRNFIEEIAIESSQFGEETVGTDTSCIWFLAPDNDPNPTDTTLKYFYYFILHDEGNTLRYGRFECADTTSDKIKVKLGSDVKTVGEDGYTLEDLLTSPTSTTKIKGDKYKLLAQHISSISCESKSGVDDKSLLSGLVTVDLVLEYNDVTNYKKTFVFAGRNMK